MRSFLLTLLAIVVAFAAFAASELRSGVWTAELVIDGLNVTMFQGRHRQGPGFGNMMTLTLQLRKLSGLSTDAANGSGADVKFALVRAAGVISFDGHFANGKGAGHFDFTPDPAFLRDMEQLGYAGFRDDELLLYAAEDLTPSSLRELKGMGYDISRRDLDDIAVFNITPARVKEYASLGYPNLTMRKLADMAIQGVTPEYIRRMQSIGVTDVQKLLDLKQTGAAEVLLKKR